MFKVIDWLKKTLGDDQPVADHSVFNRKYQAFQDLLAANNGALEVITDLEHHFYQEKPFTLAHIVGQTDRLITEVLTIVTDLNALSGNRYTELVGVAEKLGAKILSELVREKKLEKTQLVYPLQRVSLENLTEVGGKAANLGEVSNRIHLPVPPGFAVTAYACLYFLKHNHLTDFIDHKLEHLDVNNTVDLVTVSEEIQSRILSSALPDNLRAEILSAARDLNENLGPDLRLAIRSSATSEDSEASFAGQHSTVLNVSEANLEQAYKEVVASTFNPRAIFYRRNKGYSDQDVIMSVACVAMIDAATSGVIYTVDPNDSRRSVMLISAVWGLAAGAVDGSTDTDMFQIDKQTGRLVHSEVAYKATMLRPGGEEGIHEYVVEKHLIEQPCLGDEQINQLLGAARKLENHYGYPLDIEWAIDHAGKLYIIQARPLKAALKFKTEDLFDFGENKSTDVNRFDHPILLDSGVSASPGTASGRAYALRSSHMLHHVPEGAIIIAQQTSPRLVPLMGKIRGIITDVGSVTGHMASVAREFQLPTLVGTGTATKVIHHGEEITLDATRGVVYKGRVQSLLKETRPINPMKGSPVYLAVQTALKKISPLNLTDPKKDNFSPEGCETLHDIIRFAHEMSMQEMFRIGEDIGSDRSIAIRLKVYLPFLLYVVDLGGGLSVHKDSKEATTENVTSIPFNAFLKGMLHKDVDWYRDVGVQLGGFASILAQSAIRDPMKEGRVGGPNYAIVAENYLNFNARLGYHFATVDTFCGPEVNDNYVIFYFKGGAADVVRRGRRARLIAIILKELGLKVEQKVDMVRGELKKFESQVLQEKLDIIGRLCGSIRLLDMTLSDDGQVEWYALEFLKGNYSFHTDTVE